MLRNQQDRDSLPRYLETLDTSEAGSAIGNKTGALNQVRNDVAIISTKAGPIVIAGFTWDNADQRWTGDNEAEQTLGKLAKAIINRWSPQGLDAAAFPWNNPLAKSSACFQNNCTLATLLGTTKPRPARTGCLSHYGLCIISGDDRRSRKTGFYAFAILPLLMQLAHTLIRFGLPFTSALTACRFTFQRRFVTLCACEMLLPNCGPLPQTSHTCAISICSKPV